MQRQLDFRKNNGLLANKPTLPKPNGVKGKGKATAATNGYGSSSEEEEQEPEQQDEESMAMLDGADDYDVDDEQEQEPESDEEDIGEEEEEVTPPSSAKKGRGRPKKTAPLTIEEENESDAVIASIEEEAETAEEEPVRGGGKKRGRPSKKTAPEDEADTQPTRKKTKRTLDFGDEQGDSSSQATAPKPRGRKPKAAAAEAAERREASDPKAKKKPGRKRVSNGVGDTSVAEVPRGPPLPKSRGLVISRRETPGAGSMFTTRSGRTSFQPLKYWANERTELDDDDEFFDGKEKIRLPHIKNIVRYDEPEPKEKSATGRKGKGARGRPGRKKIQDHDDDGDLEPWEEDGDIIEGEVVVWQPEHELKPPGPDEQIEVAPGVEIAVSANAIETKEIRNASFKFAKMLSMPFFGSGVVDLPPHSEKKPKNSRKMHMSFFVFTGRVQVTVADTVFSIGRGGMWFVPRGKVVFPLSPWQYKQMGLS